MRLILTNVVPGVEPASPGRAPSGLADLGGLGVLAGSGPDVAPAARGQRDRTGRAHPAVAGIVNSGTAMPPRQA